MMDYLIGFLSDYLIGLIIVIALVISYYISWVKTTKMRIELAKYQALVLGDRIQSMCCCKCKLCKEFGKNDKLVINVHKKNRYIFYTKSCIKDDAEVHKTKGYIPNCDYNTLIEGILYKNVFDLRKNSGAWAGWDHTNERIYYAIDLEELRDNSTEIYSTFDEINNNEKDPI